MDLECIGIRFDCVPPELSQLIQITGKFMIGIALGEATSNLVQVNEASAGSIFCCFILCQVEGASLKRNSKQHHQQQENGPR
jgi:hypothetical protein